VSLSTVTAHDSAHLVCDMASDMFALTNTRAHGKLYAYKCIGTRPGETIDDIIPGAVVQEVYRMVPGPVPHPEGEPVSDFLHNGWNPLNGVADP
jgi:hypothetical protein